MQAARLKLGGLAQRVQREYGRPAEGAANPSRRLRMLYWRPSAWTACKTPCLAHQGDLAAGGAGLRLLIDDVVDA